MPSVLGLVGEERKDTRQEGDPQELSVPISIYLVLPLSTTLLTEFFKNKGTLKGKIISSEITVPESSPLEPWAEKYLPHMLTKCCW